MKTSSAILCVTALFLFGCVQEELPTPTNDQISTSAMMSSAFDRSRAFSSNACLVSTGNSHQLPEIFVTPDYYTSATEVGDEVRVSQFKNYFMRLASRSRVESSSAVTAREIILKLAREDRMRWGGPWRENSSNVFFFTVTGLLPVAMEYYQQKDEFTASEQELVDKYFLNKWRQLSQTTVVSAPLIDNKYATYAAFSYAVGLATNNRSAKQTGIHAYRRVISAMRPDGSNPLDSGRAGSAIHYTNLNISSLVATAELATIDGVDLYSFSGRNGGLDTSIDFLIAATRDPSLISVYANDDGDGFQGFSASNQDLRWPRNDMASWVAMYARRFPDTERTRSLARLTIGSPMRGPTISDHSLGNAFCWTFNR